MIYFQFWFLIQAPQIERVYEIETICLIHYKVYFIISKFELFKGMNHVRFLLYNCYLFCHKHMTKRFIINYKSSTNLDRNDHVWRRYSQKVRKQYIVHPWHHVFKHTFIILHFFTSLDFNMKFEI